MALPDFRWIKVVDRKRMEFAWWEPWLKNVARTRQEFSEFIKDYDPAGPGGGQGRPRPPQA